MPAPSVYFEIAGPKGAGPRAFYAEVFGWCIDAAAARIEAAGGVIILPRTVVPGIVSYALFLDPAGDRLGFAELDGGAG